FAGTLQVRLASAGADFTVQYVMNALGGRGFGTNNLTNINGASIIGNLLAPNSPFTSSFIGSGFNFSYKGYSGISATAPGSIIATNISIGYIGNLMGNGMGNYIEPNSALGSFGGNIFGNGMSGTTQQLFVDGQ